MIVTGSTFWTDADAIRRELAKLPPGTIVIHGDCDGVDALAGQVALELGLTVEAFRKKPDDHRRYRLAAWKAQNERMLASGVELVLAFHPELDRPRQRARLQSPARPCPGARSRGPGVPRLTTVHATHSPCVKSRIIRI